MSNSPTADTLRLIRTLDGYGNCSAGMLMAYLDISLPTLNRYIKKARGMGADIVSVKSGFSCYRLINGDDVRTLTNLWLELEEKGSLIQA